ncbi:hypothetical protein L914_17308 [Phytophthora nicotianae]|uniref:Uncharacterized protein n=1 Tax=Phytophthora nicotianae TaxID=4792 RepID=W2MHN6_PHYNI|nr:hypothetical protein L916_17406 [Phytophthora nicotianae]ETM35872.1 hypothetical protein L914_17308 [Phytophthora nicotianae]
MVRQNPFDPTDDLIRNQHSNTLKALEINKTRILPIKLCLKTIKASVRLQSDDTQQQRSQREHIRASSVHHQRNTLRHSAPADTGGSASQLHSGYQARGQ